MSTRLRLSSQMGPHSRFAPCLVAGDSEGTVSLLYTDCTTCVMWEMYMYISDRLLYIKHSSRVYSVSRCKPACLI
jgi:hypothetical protein